MRRAPVSDDQLHVCDGCGNLLCCPASDLTGKEGWQRKEGDGQAGHWTLLLCKGCAPKEQPA